VVRDGILDHHSQSIDGWSKTALIVLPQSRVKEVMGELHAGLSGQYLGVNNTPNEVKEHYYWLYMSNVGGGV
jgi:hypothetical protein